LETHTFQAVISNFSFEPNQPHLTCHFRLFSILGKQIQFGLSLRIFLLGKQIQFELSFQTFFNLSQTNPIQVVLLKLFFILAKQTPFKLPFEIFFFSQTNPIRVVIFLRQLGNSYHHREQRSSSDKFRISARLHPNHLLNTEQTKEDKIN